jgi:hypothetical protein
MLYPDPETINPDKKNWSKISSANGHKKGIARNCLKKNIYSHHFVEKIEAAGPLVAPQQPSNDVTYR